MNMLVRGWCNWFGGVREGLKGWRLMGSDQNHANKVNCAMHWISYPSMQVDNVGTTCNLLYKLIPTHVDACMHTSNVCSWIMNTLIIKKNNEYPVGSRPQNIYFSFFLFSEGKIIVGWYLAHGWFHDVI